MDGSIIATFVALAVALWAAYNGKREETSCVAPVVCHCEEETRRD